MSPEAAHSDEETILAWRVHLARREPRRAVVALLAVLFALTLIHLAWGAPLLVVAAGLAMLGAIGEHLFPIYYRVTNQGVYARNLWTVRRLTWPRVRRCYRDAHGLKLSPLRVPSRLEAFRGIYLWFEENEAEVRAAVERFRPRKRTP